MAKPIFQLIINSNTISTRGKNRIFFLPFVIFKLDFGSVWILWTKNLKLLRPRRMSCSCSWSCSCSGRSWGQSNEEPPTKFYKFPLDFISPSLTVLIRLRNYFAVLHCCAQIFFWLSPQLCLPNWRGMQPLCIWLIKVKFRYGCHNQASMFLILGPRWTGK